MEDFINEVNKLIKITHKKENEFQNSIDNVTNFVQQKYPEVVAEYMPSDGGITFIGLDDIEGQEFYGVQDLIKKLGVR